MYSLVKYFALTVMVVISIVKAFEYGIEEGDQYATKKYNAALSELSMRQAVTDKVYIEAVKKLRDVAESQYTFGEKEGYKSGVTQGEWNIKQIVSRACKQRYVFILGTMKHQCIPVTKL